MKWFLGGQVQEMEKVADIVEQAQGRKLTLAKHPRFADTFSMKLVEGTKLIAETLVNGATAQILVDEYSQAYSHVTVEDKR